MELNKSVKKIRRNMVELEFYWDGYGYFEDESENTDMELVETYYQNFTYPIIFPQSSFSARKSILLVCDVS